MYQVRVNFCFRKIHLQHSDNDRSINIYYIYIIGRCRYEQSLKRNYVMVNIDMYGIRIEIIIKHIHSPSFLTVLRNIRNRS